MQIESYRNRLEEFQQRLNREFLRFHSGLKDKPEFVSVYGDYSDLFCIESIRDVEAALKNESFESRRKSLEKILVFLIDQYFDLRAAPVDDEIAKFYATQKVRWEGKDIPLSEVPTRLRREPDALNRRKLHERCAKEQDELPELRKRKAARLRDAAAALGFKSWIEARERISGFRHERLLNSFEEIFRRLEDQYRERARTSMEASLGLPWQETGAWDVAHWEEKNDQPAVFSSKNLLGVVGAAITELNIRPEQPDAVALDFEDRPGKQDAPVCIPIRIPHEIKVVVAPGNGSRCYAALLHEFGHAHHFAWTSPSLPLEHRIMGDRGLAEAYGFLFEHFCYDKDWLVRQLSFSKSDGFLRFRALYRVFLIRRCAAALRFSLQVHGQGSLDDAPQIYSETMKLYTGLQHLPESWPACLDDEFTGADYLRGWVLEAMLREHLRTKYGNAWSMSRQASGFLKEIWETGLLYRAEELAREIGMGELEPQILADQLEEGLQR